MFLVANGFVAPNREQTQMNIVDFLSKIAQHPNHIQFSDTMAVIDAHYNYTPTPFKNGATYNEAGTNEGSCKVFAFAKIQGLDKAATLACFGQYYRIDVLEHPTGNDHANIRNFIQFGWDGIEFEGSPLSSK